jgi:parvulin-like peptidyl-prolyl isomerase
VGEVGNPVKTQFGFHLIKVTSRTVPPYEEAKDAVREKMTVGGQEKLLTWLQETVTKAKIEVNPKYGTFDKEGDSPGVVPPERPADTTPTTAAPLSPAPPVGGGGLPNP